jgi:hypothetical protein
MDLNLESYFAVRMDETLTLYSQSFSAVSGELSMTEWQLQFNKMKTVSKRLLSCINSI